MKNLTLIFALFLCLPFVAFSQETETEEFLYEELKPFAEKHHFGINLELNNSNPSAELNAFGSIGLSDRLNDVRTDNGLGLSIGLLYGYEFNNFISLRTQAIISALETNYIYDLTEGGIETATRETVNVEFPVHVVFENLDKKVSPAAIFGARYRYDIAQNTLTSELTGNFTGYDILLDAGVGLGFQIDDFRFKTELLYSRGLVNQIGTKEPDDLGNAINSSFTNQVSLRFIFTL